MAKQRRFGKDGRLVCHCDGSCDRYEGACEQPYRCEGHWIGPSCQYIDAINTWGDGSLPKELTDGDDDTCTKLPLEGSIEISLSITIFFTWLRIVVQTKDPASEPKLDFTKFTHGSSAGDERTSLFNPDSRSYFYRSNNPLPISGVEITKLSSVVCTVQLSGGRNVALKEQLSSSGQSTGLPKLVDGMSASLVNTRIQRNKDAWVKVKLSRGAFINEIRIFSTTSKLACKMKKFVLDVTGPGGKKISTYKEKKRKREQLLYKLNSKDLGIMRSATVSVKVSIPKRKSRFSKKCWFPFFVLGELELFGETDCSQGTGGFGCRHKCTQCSSGNCDKTLGCVPQSCSTPETVGLFCDRACPDTKWGPLCERDCPRHCLERLCQAGTGLCLECQNFFWGERCNNSCSDHCSGLGYCHPDNGRCLEGGCKMGYQPPNCTDVCEMGYYSVNCSDYCRECKADPVTKKPQCYHITGECMDGCAPGFYGDDCKDMETIMIKNKNFVEELIGDSTWLAIFIAAFGIFVIMILRRGKDSCYEDYEEASVEGKEASELSSITKPETVRSNVSPRSGGSAKTVYFDAISSSESFPSVDSDDSNPPEPGGNQNPTRQLPRGIVSIYRKQKVVYQPKQR